MEALLQDLRYGARALLRTPAFTVTTVVVLALAIGANSTLFSVMEAVLFRPLPYRDAQRLAVVWKTVPAKRIEWDWSSGPIIQDWRQRNHTLEDVAIFLRPEASQVIWTTLEGPQRIQAAKTSGNFFDLLGIQPILGRALSPQEAQRGDAFVILSHGFWQRRFAADTDVLGKPLTLDGRSFTIIGVMPPQFQFPDRNTELWLPLASDSRWALWQQEKFRIADAFGALARLKPSSSLTQARADMTMLSQALAREHPATDTGLGVRVIPLAEQIAGAGLRRSLWLLEGAVLCVLLIACSSITSLLAVRARHRQRELAIRAALGASRGRILCQLVAENLILFVTGGLLGLLAAAAGLRAVMAWAPPGVPRLEGAGISFTVFAFTVGLSVIAGAIFGTLPALQATATRPEASLRDAGRTASAGPAANRLRQYLVTIQFALAVMLLGAAGLLVRSFQLLLEVNPGFDTTHLLTMSVDLPDSRYGSEERVRAFVAQTIQKINALPGVREAAAGSAAIGIFNGQTPNESIVTSDRPFAAVPQRHDRDLVSDNYFQAMGIPLRQGRLFTSTEVPGGPAAAIVNETMARRFWPAENPLGKRFQEVLQGKAGSWMTVVGVVGDVSRNRDGLVDPTFYWSIRQWSLQRMEMVIRTDAAPGSLITAVREAVRSTDPSLPPFEVTSVEERLRELDSPRRFQTALLGVFASCALLLAAVGLHGLMVSTVVQRTREIGIRIALGATMSRVIRLIVGEGLVCALAGSVVGLAGSVAAGRALSAWLFGVNTADLPALLLVVFVLSTVTLCVGCLAALRASRIDPILALRQE
ncbi:MAG: ABC transporter permease [Bryobacteraceae bacterium]